MTSHCVLKPVTSSSLWNGIRCGSLDDCIPRCPQPGVINKGLASRNSASSTPLWQRFVHPGGKPYFVLNGDFEFYVITECNVNDEKTVGRIFDCLKFANQELQRHSIQVPSRCELFLECREDQLACNYYFVDHISKCLFWLEDVGTDLLGIPTTSISHQEIALERLYWTHVEYYPMHHESLGQGFSELVDDLYQIISRGRADRLTSRTSTFSYTADTCKEFLMLLSSRRGQPIDGYTVCYAARLAGDIRDQRLLTYYGQQSTRLERLKEMPISDASEHEPQFRDWSAVEGKRESHGVKVNNGLQETGTVEAAMTIHDIRSYFPHDLTGHVAKSSLFPFASGGHGDIFRGKLSMRGKSTDVAIKTFRVYLEQQNERPLKRIKRFRREIVVWLKLEHPNVLPLFGTVRDLSMHPDIPAMVCPWIENGALSTYLERHKNLAVARRLILVDGVALGLRYLHSQHVVHGDLSGSNVLVRADGSACIGDFGLSTLLTAIGGPTFATSHQMKGTVRWMAPELLSSNTNIDPTTESDVYSFGSTMLQILTGNIPYRHLLRDEQVIVAILRGGKPERSNAKMVTDDSWGFIQECWSMNPDKRPVTDEIIKFTHQELSKCMANEA